MFGPREGAQRKALFSWLLGTASLISLGHAVPAQGQTQAAATQEQVPEQILVTGSLIRGTVAVGAPVTNLGPQDFTQTGSLTAADLFRTVPAAVVSPGPVSTNQANVGRETEVNLRGLDSIGGYPTRALMMVDGVRVPPQGQHSGQRDPSIIPPLALDRIDVLVDGASATYGSDAVTGVINIILKRGYDGAVTQLQTTQADGESKYQASQLWGRTWDGGDVTLTYQWSDNTPLKGTARSNFTLNFTPWGLDNRIPIASSLPATLSTGSASTPAIARGIGTICSNCYALPAGSGANFNASLNSGLGPLAPSSGPGVLNWSAIGAAANAGTTNEFNPYTIGWYAAKNQENTSVATLDQRITSDISFYGEGYYDYRRSEMLNLANNTPASTQDLSVQVPTLNPYYPIGAPGNLNVNYNIGLEVPPYTNSHEIADRYLGGLKFDLPANWEGRVYYSESFNGVAGTSAAVNQAAVSAALGWTIPAGVALGTAPPTGSWTKPATVPYLNLFCDPRSFVCNSRAALQYITGHAASTTDFWIDEKGANFDGPLFSLPAGDVKAAVGGAYTSESWVYSANDNTKTPSLVAPTLQENKGGTFWAGFVQLNIPIFGEANALPLLQRLEIEASWRHDQYSQFGGTSNPKVGFNWTLSQDYGLILRGDWGTSFRAPTFGEQSAILGDVISGINVPNYAANRAVSLNCNPDPNSLAGRLLNPGPGFIGWNGVVGNNGTSGTTCGALAEPTGLGTFSTGGVAINDGFRQYVNTAEATLRPETAVNYDFTAEFAPTAFLKGLDIQATWYQVKISNALEQFGNPSNSTVNNGVLGFSYIVPTDIAKAGVDVAGCSNNNTPSTCPEFERMVAAVLNDPLNPVPTSALTRVLWINDGATGNWGWIKLQGIDFNASYDFDAGDLGAFNAGIVGTYYLHEYQANNPSVAIPNPPVTDLFHTDAGTVGGIDQPGVEEMPRMRYRARLGWSDGTWSAAGFANYVGHYFNTQNVPPNVNFQCTAAGGAVGGGTFPCAISNYTGIEPPYYTFDLSFGYNTGDRPANDYLKHVAIQLVIQNIMNKLPPFEYQIAAGTDPVAFDVSESDLGRTFGIILTKTW